MLKKWWQYQQSEWIAQYEHRFGVQPLLKSQQEIDAWFTTDLGQRILEEEQAIVGDLLKELFGYHLMQLSVLNSIDFAKDSPVSHHFSLQPQLKKQQKSECVGVAEFEHLPIESDSVDVALLHHVLDFSTSPHQLLTETARTVIPNGHILLVGFNPHSLFGLSRPLASMITRSSIYRRHQLRVGRLEDWCKILGLEIFFSQKVDYGLPINCRHWPFLNKMGRCIYPWFGNVTVLLLRKNITPMRMIKAKWKGKQTISKWGKGLVTPVSSTNISRSKNND